MIPLKTQAIQTALMGDWNTAIALNIELLNEDPNDIDTLNRLAFAYSFIGKAKEARAIYQKVLTIDSQNPIAVKNLKRLKGTLANNNGSHQIHTSFQNTSQHATLLNNMFIEENGKTKVVELVNIADHKTVSHLRTGEFLQLQIKRSKVFVLDGSKQYVGVIPDDIGRRLIKFMLGSNTYETYIKGIEEHRITIFIKEVKQAKRFKNQPSFLSGKSKMQLENNQPKHYRLTKLATSEEAEEALEE